MDIFEYKNIITNNLNTIFLCAKWLILKKITEDRLLNTKLWKLTVQH